MAAPIRPLLRLFAGNAANTATLSALLPAAIRAFFGGLLATPIRPLLRLTFPLALHQTPAAAGVISPSPKNITSAAGRCLFPLSIHGEGVADRPGVRSRVADRPGERSHGLGSEVQIEKKSLPKKNFLTPPTTTRISRPRRRDETSPWHDENRKEESDREI